MEIGDRTYARLCALAAEPGMRGFSSLVEEALESLLDRTAGGAIDPLCADAEGAWSEADVGEWQSAREEAWATWPAVRSSPPGS